MIGFGLTEAQEFWIMESEIKKDTVINLLQRTSLTWEEALAQLNYTVEDFAPYDFDEIREFSDRKNGWV